MKVTYRVTASQSSILVSLTLDVKLVLTQYPHKDMNRQMRVRFSDAKLALIETTEAHKLGLPVPVIQMARRRLQFLREAADERDLRGMKSLNFKKRKGTDSGEHTIRVNDQYRIAFTISGDENSREIIIRDISDNH